MQWQGAYLQSHQIIRVRFTNLYILRYWVYTKYIEYYLYEGYSIYKFVKIDTKGVILTNSFFSEQDFGPIAEKINFYSYFFTEK